MAIARKLSLAFDGGNARVERGNCKFGLLFLDHQGWSKTDRAFPGSQNQEAFLEGHLNNTIPQIGSRIFRALIVHDFDANHQAPASNVTYDPGPLAPIGRMSNDIGAHALCVGHVSAFNESEGDKRGGDRYRIPAKGGSMRAGLPIHHIGTGNNRAEGHPGGYSLGGAKNVWLHAGTVARPPAS